jgi:hypothetical protein
MTPVPVLVQLANGREGWLRPIPDANAFALEAERYDGRPILEVLSRLEAQARFPHLDLSSSSSPPREERGAGTAGTWRRR